MTSTRYGSALWLLPLLLPAGCTSVTENVAEGSAGAGAAAAGGAAAGGGSGSPSKGGAPAGGGEAGSASEGGAPAGGAAGAAPDPCAGGAGPKLVRVDDYCVDATEVTAGDYALFLATNPVPPITGACAFKTSFAPSCSAGADPSLPVVCVDWCDAQAYCTWAGKRLCGRIGGGDVGSGTADPAVSQWFNACSQGGARVYPYGEKYAAKACNGYDFGAGAPVPVGSPSACVGGFAGIHDMSGNVREWEHACDGATGPNDTCRNRGGSYTLIDKDFLGCANAFSATRSTRLPTLGFRCCRD